MGEKAAAILQERTELFANAFAHKHNKRVPLLANFFTWKILDAGYTMSEAILNYDIMEKINDEFHQRYNFDAYVDLGTRNPIRVTKAYGGGFHYIDESDEAVIVDDHIIMERDEYKELANNPMEFYWTKAFRRCCREGVTMAELENAAKELGIYTEFAGNMTGKYINEYGAMLQGMNTVLTPFETLFNGLRGIRELSLDIRKCKSEMKEAMDVMFEMDVQPVLDQMEGCEYPGFVAPLMTAFLGHSILSVSQFEELYWPYIKRIFDTAEKCNKPVYIFCESTMLRFCEFFQDIPKGLLMIHLEQDNIFEIRKKLPNIALVGGMTTDLLGHGTTQECIDYAKRLIDTLGDGFVLSQDKMMSYRNDAKRENLIAVNDFAREYAY